MQTNTKPFTPEEIAQIKNALLDRDLWFYRYFIFALNTGLRREEILALTWHHIDIWKKSEITVPNLKNPRFREIHAPRISINEELLGLLLELRSHSRWVFQKTGKRMLGSMVTRFFREVSQNLDIQITSERMCCTFIAMQNTQESNLYSIDTPDE